MKPIKFLSLVFCVGGFVGAHATIKNIIFDFGGVILSEVPASSDRQKVVLAETRTSDHWRDWDKGLITKQELIAFLLGQNFDAQEIEWALSANLSAQRPLINETVALVKKLKKAGYKLYMLSNLPKEAYQAFVDGKPFFELFDGMMFSYQVGRCKPDHEMYLSLLKQYSILPQESVFIDDAEKNVKSAQELGLYGILYKNGTLEAELKKLGISLGIESDLVG